MISFFKFPFIFITTLTILCFSGCTTTPLKHKHFLMLGLGGDTNIQPTFLSSDINNKADIYEIDFEDLKFVKGDYPTSNDLIELSPGLHLISIRSQWNSEINKEGVRTKYGEKISNININTFLIFMKSGVKYNYGALWRKNSYYTFIKNSLSNIIVGEDLTNIINSDNIENQESIYFAVSQLSYLEKNIRGKTRKKINRIKELCKSGGLFYISKDFKNAEKAYKNALLHASKIKTDDVFNKKEIQIWKFWKKNIKHLFETKFKSK